MDLLANLATGFRRKVIYGPTAPSLDDLLRAPRRSDEDPPKF